MTENVRNVPSVSVHYARDGTSTRSNELGMRPMQERAWEKRGRAIPSYQIATRLG